MTLFQEEASRGSWILDTFLELTNQRRWSLHTYNYGRRFIILLEVFWAASRPLWKSSKWYLPCTYHTDFLNNFLTISSISSLRPWMDVSSIQIFDVDHPSMPLLVLPRHTEITCAREQSYPMGRELNGNEIALMIPISFALYNKW